MPTMKLAFHFLGKDADFEQDITVDKISTVTFRLLLLGILADRGYLEQSKYKLMPPNCKVSYQWPDTGKEGCLYFSIFSSTKR